MFIFLTNIWVLLLSTVHISIGCVNTKDPQRTLSQNMLKPISSPTVSMHKRITAHHSATKCLSKLSKRFLFLKDPLHSWLTAACISQWLEVHWIHQAEIQMAPACFVGPKYVKKNSPRLTGAAKQVCEDDKLAEFDSLFGGLRQFFLKNMFPVLHNWSQTCIRQKGEHPTWQLFCTCWKDIL